MSGVRCLGDDELVLIRPLFEAVFKAPVSEALLRWKYGQGRGASWTVWQDDGLVLHCGLFFRNVLLQGEPTQAAQLVDLMAAPKQSGLTRHGSPFTVLMQRLLTSLPSSCNPAGLAFGFPSDRAMRLGEHVKMYACVDDWMSLEFQSSDAASGPNVRVIKKWCASDDKTVNALWGRMRNDLAAFVVGVRNSDYIRQRYLAHPEKKYLFLQIDSRWWRRPIGCVVLSQGPGQGQYEILDLICAWGDMQEVIGATQRWLHQVDGQLLTLLLTSTFAKKLAPFASQCQATQFRIMANPHMAPDGLAQLKHRWWLTGGDTDYR